jgi:hypothetical protein
MYVLNGQGGIKEEYNSGGYILHIMRGQLH